MDFLDPKKQRAHLIRLFAGYVLIGIAVLFGTLVLLYQAYGFGLDKDGDVIQKGLVFVSSRPSNAKLYLNGSLYKATTNTKLQLQAGSYKAELQRDGYRPWQRIITVQGGDVLHYDYPTLFPKTLVPTPVKTYAEAPGFASQSPDRRWIVVQQGNEVLNFDLYDVADPKKITANLTSFSLPETVVTTAKATQHSWKLVEWSTDNRHLLVSHTYTIDGASSASSEYISIDRQTPAESLNLTKTLGLSANKVLSLHDKKYDKYYVYDSEAHTLGTTTLNDAGKTSPVLDQVLAYKTYGSDMILYVTDKDTATGKPAPAGQVYSMLYDNNQSYKLREHGSSAQYLIDMAQYRNDWFVAVGSSSDNKVYVYKNPERVRKTSQTSTLVPVRILRVNAPNYLEFSANTEFVMVASGTAFADYDAETDKGYNFISKYPLDPPSSHASWMDGHRITYVSGNKLVVYDYDNINAQTLAPANANYTPYFSRDFDYVYTFVSTTVDGAPSGHGMVLTSTSFLTPADQ